MVFRTVVYIPIYAKMFPAYLLLEPTTTERDWKNFNKMNPKPVSECLVWYGGGKRKPPRVFSNAFFSQIALSSLTQNMEQDRK